MATDQPTDFLVGVIEGFYGAPWPQVERLELLGQLPGWGLNTYMYGPKDDLKHRAAWRECYDQSEATELRELLNTCRAHGLRFIYALSPGLDIHYSDANELTCLQRRLEQLFSFGCDHFALLFDDIPDQMHTADRARWDSLAAAQSHVTNATFTWARQRNAHARILFCPTPYCERMARRGLGGPNYLTTLGQQLQGEIDVFWTGPEIISREIPIQGIRDLQQVLRRKPVIWDNLHANDYDGRRFFCGPYTGRPVALRQEVRGILSNPNTELPLNDVPLRTLGAFARCEGKWNARSAYLEAMKSWSEDFVTTSRPVTLEDLILLGDCYYLPHEEGPKAQEFFELARRLTRTPPSKWGQDATSFLEQSKRLRELCGQMTELKRRPLFHALGRRVWELREELDLLEGFVRWGLGDHKAPFASDSHLHGTYRGGFVPRLQGLLTQKPDGTFAPTKSPSPIPKKRKSMAVDKSAHIRPYQPGDEPGAYYVCLKTGDYGKDGERFYREDLDALGRIYVGPYFAFEPELALILADGDGVCGYALGSFDSRVFYRRYDTEWRPKLCAEFPEPKGDPAAWSRVQSVHYLYHHPDYFCPEPYDEYPSHLHIDLLEHGRGKGQGRRMIEWILDALRRRGSPGVHLGMSALNTPAHVFYERLGFRDLIRVGEGNDASIYMGKRL